jgi:hypothetical protein
MNPPNGIDLPPRAADFRRLRATPAPAFRTIAGFMIACLAGLAMSGCTKPRAATGGAGPADVEVVQVAQSDVPIYGEWVGTLEGLVNADVKAQISGYLMKQAYTEGAFVRQGQLLFEIDARPSGGRPGNRTTGAREQPGSADHRATGAGGGAIEGGRSEPAQNPA